MGLDIDLISPNQQFPISQPNGNVADGGSVGNAGGGANVPGHVEQSPTLQTLQKLRSPLQTQNDIKQQVPEPDRHLAGSATGGIKAFFARIGRWFSEIGKARCGLPEIVQVQSPWDKGKLLDLPGDMLKGLISEVPRADRAQARLDLPRIIGERLAHAHTVITDVLAGRASDHPPATPEDASDILLYLDCRAREAGQAFENGSFQIEDKDGLLYEYLDSCEQAYLRTSTHFKDSQSLSFKHTNGTPDVNNHRGIDVPFGTKGAPYGYGTLLFGMMPADPEKSAPRRLFIKSESHGIRYSTQLLKSSSSSTTSPRPSRPGTLWDVPRSLAHMFSFLETRGKGDAAGSRKEHIPGALKKAYSQNMKMWTEVFNQEQGIDPQLRLLSNKLKDTLSSNKPLSNTKGVGVMVQNLRKAFQAIKSSRIDNNNLLQRVCNSFKDILAALNNMPDLSHVESRVGNEVIFSAEELTRDGALDGAPKQDGAPKLRDLLTDKGKFTLPTEIDKMLSELEGAKI